MNKFKSFLLGSIIRVSSLHSYSPKRTATTMHVSLAVPPVDFSSLSYKELKKLVTTRKIKGRSKLTTKAKMIAALRAS